MALANNEDISSIYTDVFERYRGAMMDSIVNHGWEMRDIQRALDRANQHIEQPLPGSTALPDQNDTLDWRMRTYTEPAQPIQYTVISAERLDKLELIEREVEALKAKLAQYEALVTPGLRFVQKQQAEKSCD